MKIAEDIDIEADAAMPVGDLNQARKMGEKLLTLQSQLEDLKEVVKDKAEEIRTLETKDLPELLASCNLKSLPFTDGTVINIKDIVKASIPSQSQIDKEKDEIKRDNLEWRRDAGMKWLRKKDIGGASLIKNILALEFSKGQDNIVGDFMGKAEELGIPALRSESVHAATLSKFVKEKMEKGVNIPKEELGVYCGQQAVVKKPR